MDTTTHELEAGQALALPLRTGDRLTVRCGSLSVQAPSRWLGETLHLPRERWLAGHSLEVADAGCWVCHASMASTLVLQRPAPLWRGWLQALRAALPGRRAQPSRMQST